MRKSIQQAVEGYLRKTGLNYFKDGDGAILIGVSCRTGLFHMLVDIIEERRYVGVQVYSGPRVPLERRAEVAEWVARANHQLRIGRFDYDIDRGDVSFSTGQFFGQARLHHDLFHTLFTCGTDLYDSYLPSLTAVAFEGRSAREAISEVGIDTPPPTDEEFHDLMEKLLSEEGGEESRDQ